MEDGRTKENAPRMKAVAKEEGGPKEMIKEE